MTSLFGKNYSKQELLSRIGDMSQLAGVKPVELVNGNERGTRALEFTTGSGLSFTVLTDRGLDIFDAKFKGASLCWHSPAGPVAPGFYDPHHTGWLWSFPGGLVTTCGLSNVGTPQEKSEEAWGLHGRISNTPAKNVSFGADWENEDYILGAAGEIREARLFGPNLVLRRNIYARLGESKIWIKDEIENQGYEETPLMFLYHCNIGYPTLDKDTEFIAVIEDMEARDKIAEAGVDTFDTFADPVPDFKEQCFYIDHDIDQNGIVNTALINRHFNGNQGLGVYLTYSKKELPYFTQWKMTGQGAYVVGLEPGNCYPEGQHNAQKRNALTTLLPGSKATFNLEIGVLESNNEIRAFEARLRELDFE